MVSRKCLLDLALGDLLVLLVQCFASVNSLDCNVFFFIKKKPQKTKLCSQENISSSLFALVAIL